MSTAVCKKCGKLVRFRKTRDAKIINARCPSCQGEIEGYTYRKHGWIGSGVEYAGEAVIV